MLNFSEIGSKLAELWLIGLETYDHMWATAAKFANNLLAKYL